MNTNSLLTFQDYGRQFADFYDDIFPREAVSDDDIAWLIGQIPQQATLVVELGVGTGRVALPLYESLHARGQTLRVVGVDISKEMLKKLIESDQTRSIETVEADICDFEYAEKPDAILCVCATISMLCDPERQAEVISRAGEALKPNGILLIETHHVDTVKNFHTNDTITYCVPYPGPRRALVSFSTLSGENWHIDHAWIDNGSATFASENSRLTTLKELDDYATAAGLTLLAHYEGFGAGPVQPSSPTVTAVYKKLR